MRKLFAILMSVGLLLAGTQAFAENMSKSDSMSKPGMGKDEMKKDSMSHDNMLKA